MRVDNLKGRTFGSLNVIERGPQRGRGSHWLCKCECGTIKTVAACALKRGETRSCGCKKKDFLKLRNFHKTHNDTGSKEYWIWRGILKRCLLTTDRAYKNYGGRGITVCDRWLKYDNFLQDMGRKPACASIDRIDNNGPYSPENCRWATSHQQSLNKRSTLKVMIGGITKTLWEWCSVYGQNPSTVRGRINWGWEPEYAVTIPARKYRA